MTYLFFINNLFVSIGKKLAITNSNKKNISVYDIAVCICNVIIFISRSKSKNSKRIEESSEFG